MSRRTAEANKAIRLAWQREHDLVQEGKGTRDWTEEQQNDILDPDKGKAYDDLGRAFEGQHMKSVEQYPEYQGDPDNIQFLTKDEHLAAHQGNWQNPTNWFYDPATKEILDFGEGKYIPCPTIKLSRPIRGIYSSDSYPESDTEDAEKTIAPESETVSHYDTKPPKRNENDKQVTQNGLKRFFERTAVVFQKPVAFYNQHKEEIKTAGKIFAAFAAAYAVEKAKNSRNTSSNPPSRSNNDPSSSDYSSENNDFEYPSDENENEDVVEENAEKKKRGPKGEETVRKHKQRYNGVWKEKEPYKRGGKKDSSSDD